jgi:hypothetical protein
MACLPGREPNLGDKKICRDREGRWEGGRINQDGGVRECFQVPGMKLSKLANYAC